MDDGSTAKTAIFSPLLVKNLPKLSRKVLLPAPGGPDKPGEFIKLVNVIFVETKEVCTYSKTLPSCS